MINLKTRKLRPLSINVQSDLKGNVKVSREKFEDSVAYSEVEEILKGAYRVELTPGGDFGCVNLFTDEPDYLLPTPDKMQQKDDVISSLQDDVMKMAEERDKWNNIANSHAKKQHELEDKLEEEKKEACRWSAKAGRLEAALRVCIDEMLSHYEGRVSGTKWERELRQALALVGTEEEKKQGFPYLLRLNSRS